MRSTARLTGLALWLAGPLAVTLATVLPGRGHQMVTGVAGAGPGDATRLMTWTHVAGAGIVSAHERGTDGTTAGPERLCRPAGQQRRRDSSDAASEAFIERRFGGSGPRRRP